VSDPNREISDLFSVAQLETTSIPPVAEIVLPPDEQRKQRARRIAVTVAVAVLALLSAWAVRFFWHAHSVEESVLAAGASGRPADIDTALSTLDDGEAPGLRARLIAMAALSGARPVEEARAAVDAVEADDSDSAAERLKAIIYLALAEGRTADALESASAILSAAGTYGPETGHAKGLAATANGNATEGAQQAGAAATALPVPRYEAALALAQAQLGQVDEALTHCTRDNADEQSAKARILALAHRPAIEAATACLSRDDLTPSESGWCSLARAMDEAHRGLSSAARESVGAAVTSPPPGDALFRWHAAETLLIAGDVTAAREVIANVDATAPVADVGVRARVQARLALVEGDANSVIEVLSTVPGTPDAHLLVARAQILRDDLDGARTSAASASEGAFIAEAQALIAGIEVAAENAEAAAAAARISLEAAPAHAAYIQDNVAALLLAGAEDEASAAAEAALTATPNDIRTLLPVADVRLSAEDWPAALTVLNEAAEIEADNIGVQSRRGDAARFSDNADIARAAYAATLAQEEAHPGALVGMLAVLVEAGDVEEAVATLARIDAADLRETHELALLRVRTLVDSGTGYSGLSAVNRVKRRRDTRGDASLRISIAELLLQAELYQRAVGMFDQSRVLGHDRVEAFLGRALAWAMEGRTNKANEAMRSALDAAIPADAEEGAPSPAANHPRLLVVRGRIEANLGRYPSAKTYAERALEASPLMAEAHMLLADVAGRMRQDPEEHLRAAAALPRPVPRAWWLLARRAGANEEGCALAQRYLDAAPRSENASDVRDFIDRCD
jgi:tetratricopeptide (TPR) repeat protein